MTGNDMAEMPHIIYEDCGDTNVSNEYRCGTKENPGYWRFYSNEQDQTDTIEDGTTKFARCGPPACSDKECNKREPVDCIS